MSDGNTFLISGLKAKRSAMAGRIVDLRRELYRLEADLVHVDAVLRLYGLEGSELPSKGHVSIRSAYFARNELSRRCRDLLRERGTISADDVTVSAMLDKGLDPETERRLRTDFTRRILVTLHDLKKIGQVQQVGRGKGTRWTLPDEAEQPTRLFS